MNQKNCSLFLKGGKISLKHTNNRAWKKYEITRHPERPRSSEIINELFSDFIPYVQGFPKDHALITGSANFKNQKVFIIAQEKPKGQTLEEQAKVNFGMVKPEGYALALKIMDLADKTNSPLITIIDTPGGDPFEHSAEFLQSWKISDCIFKMAGLKTRTIALILGEGGSGGALALQVADRTLMMENAVYSVMSPEGCSSIILRNPARKEEAANLQKPTSDDMLAFGIIDDIIPEPEGGAHNDHKTTIINIEKKLSLTLNELNHLDLKKLLKSRYKRFTNYGEFKEDVSEVFKQKTMKSVHAIEKKFEKIFSKLKKIGDHLTLHLAKTAKNEEIKDLHKTEYYECEKCKTHISFQTFLDNFKTCSKCGALNRKYYLSAHEWIDCIADKNSFIEHEKFLVPRDALKFSYKYEGKTKSYKETVKNAQKKKGVKEALIIGEAKIFETPVVVAVSEFGFLGGSMGSVVGEKFLRAVKLTNSKKCPLISIALSGGARMHEGILSLMQMAKTNMALTKLKKPYISVLADPTFGGTLASFSTQGTIILAEKNAQLGFAGPRVTKLISGNSIDDKYYTAEFYLERGGVNEVASRREMKETVHKYILSLM